MKKTLLALLLVYCVCLVGDAQIHTYPWPSNSELVSNEKYTIRARTYNSSNQTYGAWVDMSVILSLPRDYPEHWKVGGDAMTGFMKDRSLSFAAFSFQGTIEVEVTQKLSSQNAVFVDISPRAYSLNPHFFDGKSVRFFMDKPEYVSINFDFGTNDSSINRDDNRASGLDIKHGCMLFTELPESQLGYAIPSPDSPGVVVWDNNTDLSTILAADIIYFPAGEHIMRNHKNRWERNSEQTYEERHGNWVTTKAEYDAADMYRGRLHLKKNNQKVYLAPGAIVHGGFHSNGKTGNWLYGLGIISGRKHLMHELIKPEAQKPISIDQPYHQITQTKQAHVYYGNGAVYNGPVFLEAWHHTCPSGRDSTIKNVKIVGWCSNNDGIRPAGGSTVDRIFVKTSDDIDYARDPKVVSNAVFWPMVNGAMGMLGWSNLGTGYAEYYNIHIINSEWHLDNPSKSNIGIVGGGQAAAGIKLQGNVYQNFHIQNRTNYLVFVAPRGGGNGFLKNFLLKNITTEYPLSNAAGKIVKQELKGISDTWVEGWTFTNVFIDGVLLTWNNYKEYFNLDLAGSNGSNSDDSRKVRNITFNSQGAIRDISYSHNAGGSVRPQGANGVIKVANGMSQTISIIPDNGKKIVDVKVNGVSKGRMQNLLLKEISSNQIVEVVFGNGDDFFNNAPEPGQQGPTDITNLTATALTCNSVRLSWGDVQGEDGYRIRRAFPGETYLNIADVPANTVSYTDATVAPNSTYVYMVRPLVGGSAVKVSNVPSVTTPSCSTPLSGVVFIKNKTTNKKIRPKGNEGVAQAPGEWTGSWVQWEVVPTSGEYFRLKNLGNNQFLSMPDTNDHAVIVTATTTTTKEEWKRVTMTDGFFLLENRASGKRIRCNANVDYDSHPAGDYLVKVSPLTSQNDWVRWSFE